MEYPFAWNRSLFATSLARSLMVSQTKRSPPASFRATPPLGRDDFFPRLPLPFFAGLRMGSAPATAEDMVFEAAAAQGFPWIWLSFVGQCNSQPRKAKSRKEFTDLHPSPEPAGNESLRRFVGGGMRDSGRPLSPEVDAVELGAKCCRFRAPSASLRTASCRCCTSNTSKDTSSRPPQFESRSTPSAAASDRYC